MSWRFWESEYDEERIGFLENEISMLQKEIERLKEATAIDAGYDRSQRKFNRADNERPSGGGALIPPGYVELILGHYRAPVNDVVLLILDHLGLSVDKVEEKFTLTKNSTATKKTKHRTKKA